MSPKHWMRAFSVVALTAVFASAYVGSPLNRPGNVSVPQGEGPTFGDAEELVGKPPMTFEQAIGKQKASGPYVSELFYASSFDGDLRDLPVEVGNVRVVDGEIVMPENPAEAGLEGSKAYVAAALPDPNVQRTQGSTDMPSPIITFDGLNNQHNFALFGGRINPPDTNGDVGPNHYIQTVNLVYGIFDKAGNRLVGPAKMSAIFAASQTGTTCDTNDNGDPVVNYDPLADRWILSQFAFASQTASPFYQCFAISKGPNPVTDGWWTYAVRIDGSFPDYPKVSVWPDAYYFTARMFPVENPEFFQSAFALERSAMLAGRPMRYVQFNMPGTYDSMLAANVRNGDIPPAGTPGIIAVSDDPNDDIVFWRTHVDWNNPANSTMSPEIHVDVNPFERACPTANRDCIPFSGSTATTMLDALSERVMFNLQYRRIGNTESLWANQTITESGKTAVRWYEFHLSRTGNVVTPTVYQQSTFNPADGVWRWMGSIAADGAGNAAIGYSASSPSIDPQIRYVGRLVNDPLGSMPQAEVTMTVGTGHPTTTNSRWGDYSAMMVDPADDCTFWYTTEYYTTTTGIPGDTRPWTTRIGSFKFPSCTALPTGGTLTATVLNASTMQPLANMPIWASNTGITRTYAGATNASGMFTLTVLPGTYTVTAGPLDYAGYPTAASASGLVVDSNTTNGAVILLNGSSYLTAGPRSYNDTAQGNGNTYPEPGEKNIAVSLWLTNTGVTTASVAELGGISSQLISLTPGFTVVTSTTGYPNIAPGTAAANTNPFYISINGGLACGTVGNFQQVVWTSARTYTIPFTLRLGIPPNYSCTYPVPNLNIGAWVVAENGGTTNGDGYIEPGEGPFSLTINLSNSGLTNLGAATNINSALTDLTTLVTVTSGASAYPNLAANATAPNNTPFAFTVNSNLACGAPLEFDFTATSTEGTYSRHLLIPTGAPSAAALPFILDDVEAGPGMWVTTTNSSLGGFRISTEDAHSPSHSWVEAEGANYPSSLDTTLTSPEFDFTAYDAIDLSFWHRYATEAGFDYGFIETSRDGGTTWDVVVAYDGTAAWSQETLDLSPYLAYASSAYIRFHFTSDTSVTDAGWFVDDIALTANPRVCNPSKLQMSTLNGTATQFSGIIVTRTAQVTNTGSTTLDWATDESTMLRAPVATTGQALAADLVRNTSHRTPESQTPAGRLPTIVPQAALVDGSFESSQGYDDPYWDEFSANFGTPLCDAGCGSAPSYSGDWFLWYGGAGSNTAEEGYVGQTALIPSGSAWLSFWLRMNGTGEGVFTITVDGNQVFNVTQAQTPTYANYTQVMVDISAYADGGAHYIMFAEADPATVGNFSVFVDDISLFSFPDVACGGTLPWLTVSPAAGSLDSGESGTLNVAFNSTGLAAGTYTGTVCLASNDPTWPLRVMPVSLVVLNAGSTAVNPTPVITGTPGSVVTYSVTVTNTGELTDTFGIAVTGSTYTVTGPSSVGPLAPGASTTLSFGVQIPTGNTFPLTNMANVWFTSQNDSNRVTNVTLTTNASIYRRYLPLIKK